jgi:hypothetical protein
VCAFAHTRVAGGVRVWACVRFGGARPMGQSWFVVRFIKVSFLHRHYSDWKDWLEYDDTALRDDVVAIIDGQDTYNHGRNPCRKRESGDDEFAFFKAFIRKVKQNDACVDMLAIPFWDNYCCCCS